MPVTAYAPSLKQEQSPYRMILLQKTQNHIGQDFQLIPSEADAFSGQPHSRIDLLPGMFKNCFENALFIRGVFDELGLTSTRQAADRRGVVASKPRSAKRILAASRRRSLLEAIVRLFCLGSILRPPSS